MLNLTMRQQPIPFLQVLADQRICILYIQSLEISHNICEIATFIKRLNRIISFDDLVLYADLVIFLTVGWGYVDYTSSFLRGNKTSREHFKTAIFSPFLLEIIKQWNILYSNQICSQILLEDSVIIFRFIQRLQSALGKNVDFTCTFVFKLQVYEFWINRDGQI